MQGEVGAVALLLKFPTSTINPHTVLFAYFAAAKTCGMDQLLKKLHYDFNLLQYLKNGPRLILWLIKLMFYSLSYKYSHINVSKQNWKMFIVVMYSNCPIVLLNSDFYGKGRTNAELLGSMNIIITTMPETRHLLIYISIPFRYHEKITTPLTLLPSSGKHPTVLRCISVTSPNKPDMANPLNTNSNKI